ncbi:uncharacterized, partial [Tachysurus ichikawai]
QPQCEVETRVSVCLLIRGSRRPERLQASRDLQENGCRAVRRSCGCLDCRRRLGSELYQERWLV